MADHIVRTTTTTTTDNPLQTSIIKSTEAIPTVLANGNYAIMSNGKFGPTIPTGFRMSKLCSPHGDTDSFTSSTSRNTFDEGYSDDDDESSDVNTIKIGAIKKHHHHRRRQSAGGVNNALDKHHPATQHRDIRLSHSLSTTQCSSSSSCSATSDSDEDISIFGREIKASYLEQVVSGPATPIKIPPPSTDSSIESDENSGSLLPDEDAPMCPIVGESNVAFNDDDDEKVNADEACIKSGLPCLEPCHNVEPSVIVNTDQQYPSLPTPSDSGFVSLYVNGKRCLVMVANNKFVYDQELSLSDSVESGKLMLGSHFTFLERINFEVLFLSCHALMMVHFHDFGDCVTVC